MLAEVTISVRSLGKKKPLEPDWKVPFPPDLPPDGEWLTLRNLITRIVRQEVDAFRQRQQDHRLVRILSEREIGSGLERGRVDSGGREFNHRVDEEEAVAVALLGFEDGLYIVILDGEEQRDLDRQIYLRPDSRLTFLETVDEAHPQAFRRMLRLVLDHDLARFSATVRAFDTWLGYRWDAISSGVVNKVIEKLLLYLDEADARAKALSDKDAEQAYLALWTLAFHDAVASVESAVALLNHRKAEHRFVAAHLLAQLGFVDAEQRMLAALDDQDLRVAASALSLIRPHLKSTTIHDGLFERLDKLRLRFPLKKTKFPPIVWPWCEFTLDQSMVAGVMLQSLGDRPPTRLIPLLPCMDGHQRAQTVALLHEAKKWDAATRETLFAMVGDASRGVREAALRGLMKCEIAPAEAPGLENLLSRTSGDLRRGVLMLLLRQSDEATLASAERLLVASSALQRQAGLELLRQLTEAKRSVPACQSRAGRYKQSHPTLAPAEQQHLDAILEAGGATVSLDDALGLMDPAQRTQPSYPVNRGALLHSAAARAILKSLDDLIHEHREDRFTIKQHDGTEISPQHEELLGNATHTFPGPSHVKPLEEDLPHLPFRDLWTQWWEQRDARLRDGDGFELARAMVILRLSRWLEAEIPFLKRNKAQLATIFGEEELPEQRYPHISELLFFWLLKETVLSKLIRRAFPRESETHTDFKTKALAADLPDQRLVDLALYAPQWSAFVEHTLGWQSFTEAVWWIHAHTKGVDWSVDHEIREIWQADLSRRTSLSGQDLIEGAVDVAWFKRVHADLGPKRWSVLDEAARYSSSGGGHARARLFAEAMLGKIPKKELLLRIRQKRHQDAVRALGLLPLATCPKREGDLLDRYKVLQEFIRTSRQFGSQRQASEKRAAQIGQHNLARTAGYPDPIRLQWAMEAKAVEDLADVPPRLFSETMRDLDLVVSVAHRGGVDPEASASTLEMRSRLLRETCALLQLKNVRLKEPYALIDGQLAQYTVHLGSAGVKKMPGGAVFIVPVHSQHRGRLFLPFADDDPKTAEVMSKVLMLARDHEIKDPQLLDQLR